MSTKIYLCDNADGESVFIRAKGWDQAEKLAKEKNLVLVGEFVNWTDEDGNVEYLH